MSRYTISLAVGVVLLLTLSASAWAAPSILGTSGNLITPDDTVLASGAFNLGYHGVDTEGDTFSVFAANIGLLPNLEVGAAVATNGDTDVLINGKYRILAENASRPAVTVGVIDAGSQLTDDAGIYLMVSKNLTATAEEAVDEPTGPVRGHLGVGSGAVKGIFAALDWTVSRKLTFMGELISDSQFNGEDTMVNFGARYALTNELRVDVGILDLDDFTWGISYQGLRF